MLLSPHPLHPSPLPKTLTKFSSSLFSIPKTLIIFPTLKTRPIFLIRSSLPDSNSLPHSAIQRIAQKLRSLGFTSDDENHSNSNSTPNPTPQPPAAAGHIFIPLPNQLPKYRVGHTLDNSWSTPENPVPRPGSGNAIVRYHEVRKVAERERRERERDRVKVPTLAELRLPVAELRRLRAVGMAERRKLKVGKAGITEGIVNGVHERWRRAEVVKIVCEDLCRINMKRTHDLLERKTGGMVVWRVGSKIILYRGENYKYPYFSSDTTNETSAAQIAHLDCEGIEKIGSSSNNINDVKSSGPNPTNQMMRTSLIQGVGSPTRVRFQLPGEAQLAEEADRLLEGLGPRFTDWWGYDPLPIDADLLPAVIPGYRRPFRLLPYGVKPKLTDDEMTTIRRLGRPLPCHFALGRNKKLQGLAASIVKLWEKCEIVKIAVKRGVQNTNSEMMAEELKWLTGGTLLSRDREFIVLYRGKDFLPSAVSSAIEERRKYVLHGSNQSLDHSVSDKIAELKVENENCGSGEELDHSDDQRCVLPEQKKLKSTETAIRRTNIKLSMALEKKAKAEQLLKELEKAELRQQPEVDKEGITEEERYMLRKVGLKMKPFLLMGRRGVFDGTIENMHLHWKYRELVKIICKERSFGVVNSVARTLETESGGILVAVERVSKGYAIVVYRGKNYRRPARLRPPTLLSKREAMKRSLEAQRRESLKLHVLKLNRNIDNLKLQLVKDQEAHNRQSFDESSIQVKEVGRNVKVAAPVRSHTDLKSEAISVKCTENIEARDNHGADAIPDELNDSLDTSNISVEPANLASQSNISSLFDGNETDKSEPETTSELVNNEALEIRLIDTNAGVVGSASCLDNMSEERRCSPIRHAKHGTSDKAELCSRVVSAENELGKLVMIEKENQIPSKVQLSNKDRLLLRKQALKMKNRPVLAVGRSNIVTGVAKAIKVHFKRYPLAVVNVKGRAKGTSVQEVILKLEQATGAIFVSQEPSKVILYRGWGAKLELGKTRKESVGREARDERAAVSPELIAAIRLECGLQHQQEKGKTSSHEMLDC